MSLGKLPVLLFVLLTVSCGGGKDQSSSRKTVPLVPEQMEEILDRQSFRCRDREADCPYGIGRLFILNAEDVSTSSVCTGFLVSGDKLLTNNHCVSTDEDCRNTYVSIRTRNGPVKARCLELEYTRADSGLPNQRSVDLSVLKLDVVIPPSHFSLATTRALVGTMLKAWVVDHVSVTEAVITPLSCAYEKKEASMLLRNCPAISGNSGSPVVNAGGEVVGILWGSNLPPSIDATFPFDLRLSLPSLSVATELHPFRNRISGSDSSPR